MSIGDAAGGVGGSSSDGRSAAELIAAADLDGARRAIAGAAVRTPTLACADLGQVADTAVALKAECLQGTGSFKLRGALSKVAALGERASAGLVTASAGNHARAVAQAARVRGVDCEVFMPRDAAVSKVVAVERLGANVELDGASVDEALGLARERAERSGAALVHPFDDLDVIAGQGTLALELLEDVPDLARVVVPVGGGGLASGIGIALRRAGADVELVGVQARACAPYVQALAEDGGLADALDLAAGATIADGIAIKHPGTLTLPLLRELLDGIETVNEEEIAEAMVFMAEHAKLVAEGAGAVAVAALRSGRLRAGVGHDGGDRVGRQRRQRVAGGAAAAPRNCGGPARAPVHPRAGPPGRPGGAAGAGGANPREPGDGRARARSGPAARARDWHRADAGDARAGSH